MRGTLIGSCGGLEFDSYNPFHEAIDLKSTNCLKLGVRPFLRNAVSPNLHTLVRYLMRGMLIGSCRRLEFDSYNPFHQAIDTSGPPTALN